MILVCGEALMDVFATNTTPSGLSLDARVGGSPFNVAVGLARLGQPVGLLAGISRGFLGERLMQALQHDGVHTGTVWRSNAPTTLSLVGLDAAGVASYAFYGQDAADRCVPLQALDAVATPQALHLGSYSAVVEPVATTLRSMVQRVQGQALVSYDPNVRLGVEPDIAVWRAQLQWMLPRTQLLKLSDEDLHALHPGADPDALAAHWLAQGVRLVVLTQGAEGATAWTPRWRMHMPPKPVQVVDTVGAGDTFQAALLSWAGEHGRLRADGLDGMPQAAVAQALQFATQAAALTCTRRGADLPRRSDIT